MSPAGKTPGNEIPKQSQSRMSQKVLCIRCRTLRRLLGLRLYRRLQSVRMATQVLCIRCRSLGRLLGARFQSGYESTNYNKSGPRSPLHPMTWPGKTPGNEIENNSSNNQEWPRGPVHPMSYQPPGSTILLMINPITPEWFLDRSYYIYIYIILYIIYIYIYIYIYLIYYKVYLQRERPTFLG